LIALKRTLLILAPLIGSTLLFAGALKYFDPEIQSFILRQLQKQSAVHSPIEIQADEFHYSFLPPTLTLDRVHIAPKENIGIDQIEIEKIQAKLDLLQLFGGRIMISELTVEQPSFDLALDELPKSEKETTRVDLNSFFRTLKLIPLSQIRLIDLEALAYSKIKDFELEISNTSLTILNHGDQLYAEVDLYANNLQFQKWKDDAILRSALLLSSKNLEIQYFKLDAFGVQLDLSALTNDLPQILTQPKAVGSLKLKTDLSNLHDKIKSAIQLPKLTGSISTKVDFRTKGFDWPEANITFQSSKITIEGFDVGNVDFNGVIQNKKFISNSIQVTNEASTINLSDFEMREEEKQYLFKAKLDTEMLDLNELLKRLQVGDIPLELITAGHFDCHGGLYPKFAVDCSGHAEGDALEVRTDNKTRKNILAIEKFNAKGDVRIDLERVWYKGQAQIGTSKGQSEGIIRYDTGFDISYSSDETDFQDIGKLAGLKIEGKAKLSGRTWGDSHQGQLIINVESQDVWLEDYLLGHAKTNVRYSKGKLYFDNLESTIGSSKYSGSVIANLLTDQLEIDASSKQFELSDITKAFHRKAQLPIDFAGLAEIELTAHGPYDFSRFSYLLKTNIAQGSIAGEGFNSIAAEIESEKGNVKANQFLLKKGQGQISGKGIASPNGQIDVTLEGQSLQLEESENISKLGVPVAGALQANLHLNGHILNPDIQLTTEIGTMIIDEQEFQPSSSNVKINRHSISGNANLFKNKLTADFVLPFSNNSPFKFQASARDWNYTTLFAFLGGGFLLGDYKASMTGDLDLRSEKGGIFKSTGKGSVERFSIKRGNVELANPGPMELNLNKGVLALKDFRISNEDSYLEMSSQNTTAEKIDIRARGKIGLHILQIFMPFLEELNGQGSFQMQIGGKLEKPEIFGNAKIQDGFVKLKAFPHPFEKIESNIQFSQSRILMTQLDSILAGGTLKGEGLIRIEGLKNFPVNLKGKLEGATFLIPERFRTSGFAEVAITGSWFPFTLSSTYHIQSGFIDKEFSTETLGGTVKQSSYLPKTVLQSGFNPIELNIQTLIEKPISIRNSNFDGQVTGGVLIKGTPDLPILSGKINIEKGSHLVFNNTPFDVSTGSVSFTNPKETNPEIYIAGRSRVLDYEVNLLAQGTAKNPLIRMTSQPPLPEHDIISLLAFGVTSATLDKNSIASQKNSSDQNMKNVAETFFANKLTEAAKTTPVPLQFQASSQYDDTKNISVQKYTVGYRVSEKFTISASTQKADISSNEYKLKYSFNPKWSATATYENRENSQTGSTSESQRQGSIWGFDFEYKQEFK